MSVLGTLASFGKAARRSASIALLSLAAAALLITLLILAACTSPQDTPTEAPAPTSVPTSTPVKNVTPMPSPTSAPTSASGETLSPTPTSTPSPTPTPASMPGATLTPTPGLSYLTEEIPPCTHLEGSSVDPCEPDIRIPTRISAGFGYSSIRYYDKPTTVRQSLEGPINSISHIVLRGTYIPYTVRCESGVPNRTPSYVMPGYFQYSIMILCYADVRVNGYILGNGPSTLTVLVRFLPYWEGWFAKDAEQFGMTEGEAVDLIRKNEEVILEEGPQRTGGIGGREVVLFIGPTRYHANEVWQVYDTWGLERRENEAVVVVHPHRDDWRRFRPDDYETYLSALEMELPDFTEAVTEANQARVTDYAGHIAPAGIEGRAEGVELPTLVTDVHSLDEFLQDTGAYSHPDGTPAQPLPPCGLAVHGEDYNYDLMIDCQTLLAAKDTLQGTATLNWSVDTAITGWDGVATSGTPSRLTELDLSSERLTGSIPAELGDLSELTHLDLSSNSLTGEIPRELGGLSNLTEIRLSGNFLTGCIPLGLKDVTTNDLSSLNLLYCPPVPEGLTVGTVAENTIPLSWSPVSNVSKYRVEYRVGYRVEWTVDDDALTTTTHTVDDLDCERVYQLRVRAYGDGTTHAADWSDPSELETETTGTCTPPTFDEVSYTFEVAEHTAVDAIVGSVSATDPADDSLTYSIIEGNDDGHFSIEVASGDIKVAAVLDYSNKSTYPLKVEVTDGTLTDTVDVTINVYVDYDMDNDGLIDVSNLAQLNAMRWDLDGNGSSTESGYAAAFPGARFDLACPSCNSSEP